MNKIILAAPLVALAAIAGCTHGGPVKAHASVAATNTSAKYAKLTAQQVLGKCAPAQNPVTQLKWLRVMIAGKHSKDYQQGVAARHAFLVCANNGQPVTAAEQARFQQEVQTQGEAALKAYAHDESTGDKAGAKAAVKNFAENQVEQDAVNAR